MNIFKKLEKYIADSNQKAFDNFEKRYKSDLLPVEMNLIETKSGCKLEFVSEQSKINLGESFRRAELKARKPQNIDESLNS